MFWSRFWFWMVLVAALAVPLQEKKYITAVAGQNVILPCKVPNNNKPITAVEWSRSELDPEFVLLYRDKRFDVDNQHPSYKNRVDLQDKEMKDGDFSLVLKDVTKNDTGRYECHVSQGEITSKSIYLDVFSPAKKIENTGGGVIKVGGNKDEGYKDGINVGAAVGVILLLAVACVGFWFYRRLTKKNANLPVPPEEPVVQPALHFLIFPAGIKTSSFHQLESSVRSAVRSAASFGSRGLLIFASAGFIVCSSDHRVDVKPGDNALLPCRAPGDENIKLVDWQRVGLNTSPADILVIRDGKKLPDQHPSVHGRVELKDPQMKNRDVSVTLKNVTINDTGTYECRVKTDRTIGSPPELINTIQLRVNHSGQPEDSEDDGAKNEGPKNEGPKNEGPKHEGPSDPIAVLKLLCILFGPPLVIVLCLSVLGIVCGILADCQEACSTELMEVIPV
ncbi:uncharacterized protein LOC127532732 [Acanthochromis polyacanthus]|uniref:uncharacterized protein LOC127532732 n=1 Tax=Acanthochromis polyacanthus TaxID=80966 RepID=UPI002234A526|nr:uncharacterized protein LOC127532732 [Acanthochromis polyacanthus]